MQINFEFKKEVGAKVKFVMSQAITHLTVFVQYLLFPIL
jgi:hypothetical protein